jgi:hypothetical protein
MFYRCDTFLWGLQYTCNMHDPTRGVTLHIAAGPISVGPCRYTDLLVCGVYSKSVPVPIMHDPIRGYPTWGLLL